MGPFGRGVRTAVLVAALIALLAVTSPPAAAQLEVVVNPPVALAVTVTPHGQPIEPSTGLGTASVEIAVTCTAPGVYTDPVEVLLNAGSSAPYAFASPVDLAVYVTFEPQDCAAQPTTKKNTTLVDITFTSRAPAFETVPLTFTAVANTTSGTGEWTERVGFAGTLTAKVNNQFEEKDGVIPVMGKITNAANGDISVQVDVSEAPTYGRLEPADQKIEIPFGDQRASVAEFSFDYIPSERQIDGFTLRFTGTSTVDSTEQLDPYVVEVTIDPINNAIYSTGERKENTPGPPVIAFAGCAMLAFALLRRR